MSAPPGGIAPFAEDLVPGVPLATAPDLTIDAGVAAAYLAITGDGLRPTLSDESSRLLTGRDERLVNPALVLSASIGQSTVATGRVIANLQYRDVALRDAVHVGDTVRTEVTPLGADWTRSGRDRAKVLLGMRLTRGGDILAEYQRLALLPVREADRLVATGIPEPAAPAPLHSFASLIPSSWTSPEATTALSAGDEWEDPQADSVSSARELVRLTQNRAAAHRDHRRGQGGRRLVYGGHTIGLAQASLSRCLPDVLSVPAWRSCDHLGPVFEDDLLEFSARVDEVVNVGDFRLADVRVTARAVRDEGRLDVLDWRAVVLLSGTEGGSGGAHS